MAKRFVTAITPKGKRLEREVREARANSGVLRGAVYARNSDRKGKERSNERQIEESDGWASRNGVTIVARFADRRETGRKSAGRAGYQALIKQIENGEFDVVIVESIDRIARFIGDAGLFYQMLKYNHCRLATRNLGWMDDGTFDVESISSGNFSNLLKVRVSQEMRRTVESGEWPGGVGYGFRYDRTVESRVKLAPEEVPIIARAFKLADDGFSPEAIAKLFNTDKIPAPGGAPLWTWQHLSLKRPSAFRGILHNAMATGVFEWGRTQQDFHPVTGKIVVKAASEAAQGEVSHLAIVTTELFNRVQDRLGVPKVISRREEGIHLFGEKLFCSGCGLRMHRAETNYIRCDGQRTKGIKRCELSIAPLLPVQIAVLDLAEELIRAEGLERVDPRALQRATERQIASVHKKIDDLFDAETAGEEVDPDLVRHHLDELEDLKSQLQAQADKGRPFVFARPIPNGKFIRNEDCHSLVRKTLIEVVERVSVALNTTRTHASLVIDLRKGDGTVESKTAVIRVQNRASPVRGVDTSFENAHSHYACNDHEFAQIETLFREHHIRRPLRPSIDHVLMCVRGGVKKRQFEERGIKYPEKTLRNLVKHGILDRVLDITDRPDLKERAVAA